MNEIRVWKIVPLRMVTTSEQERDKWIAAGHEVVEFVSIERIAQLETELAAALEQYHSEDALNMVQSQAQQESQWISVDERLPDGDRFVDVFVKSRSNLAYGTRFTEFRFINGMFDVSSLPSACYVTHWMPLPPAPEGE